MKEIIFSEIDKARSEYIGIGYIFSDVVREDQPILVVFNSGVGGFVHLTKMIHAVSYTIHAIGKRGSYEASASFNSITDLVKAYSGAARFFTYQ